MVNSGFVFWKLLELKNFSITFISKRFLLLLFSFHGILFLLLHCSLLLHYLYDDIIIVDIIIFKVFFWSLLSLFPLALFSFLWWSILISDFPHWGCSFLNSVNSVTTFWNIFILQNLAGSLSAVVFSVLFVLVGLRLVVVVVNVYYIIC